MTVRDLFDDDLEWDDMSPSMTFYEYEEAAMDCAIYDHELIYPVLGLLSEAGEVADKVKKIMRDEEIEVIDPILDLNAEQRKAIALELSDVLWYVTATAADLGYGLDEIASMNIDKLQSRKRRGRIKGSGDNR